MNIKILRGACEIGGSCVEVQHRDSRIILDIGLPLYCRSEDITHAQDRAMPGEELNCAGIFPEAEGLYKWDKSSNNIDGLLISHAHLDHYGLYSFVHRDIPVWMGEGTKRLMNLTACFTSGDNKVDKTNYLKSGISFQCGAFKVTPYLMDHSAFDAYAFLVEADGSKIFYSGDFREHGRKRKAFYWFLNNAPCNVDALLLEGTMLGRLTARIQTEEDIERKIVEVVSQTKGPVFFHSSGQNIDRLVSFYKAAQTANRTMVVDVYTAEVLDQLKGLARIPHAGHQFERIRVFYPYRLCRRMIREGNSDTLKKFRRWEIKIDEIFRNASSMMMLVRGSMLDDIKSVGNFNGAAFINSMWEGYLHEERMEPMNVWVKDNQMNFYQIHTSGHAGIATLQKVITALKPRLIVPIHTDSPNRYRLLSENVRLLEDGEVLEL